MDIRKDNKLFDAYNDMLQSMARSIKNPNTAELLFWYTAYPLIARSRSAAKSDILGIIMKRFTGDSSGCIDIVYAVADHAESYIRFNQNYGLADKLSELGDHWREIFRKDRFGQILILRGWLKMFLNECMPAINEMISECEDEWKDLPHNMLLEKDLKARQRAYTSYKRTLQTLLTKLEAAKEFYDLRREDPAYYKTED